ncbi:class I SAM-dependent methyltransferase [Salisaeta longa]|uniref:class I SAM-dependent methyltransferase n=1 Tax=Salisaeta longa TaxID=503170 RepID=UPI0003B35B83|nr:class I SAM-dependent methyltransferase [Salisaeta longa]
MPTLDRPALRALYDRVGRWQDTQAFYEEPAKDWLLAHGPWPDAATVVEVGGGTGRFAARLVRQYPQVRYVGFELSPTMARLTAERLPPARATVHVTDGRPPFPRDDASADAVVLNYVLDLLAPAALHAMIREARRLLRPGGALCIASLARTDGGVPGRLCAGWVWLHRRWPALVGGCRPIEAVRYVNCYAWTCVTVQRVCPWGLCSDAIVALK